MRTLWLLAAALAACVPLPDEIVPPDQRQPSTITQGPFGPLDAGASDQDSLHFKVSAYGPDTARQVSQIAEDAYNRIMVDTGLYSFQPRGLYRVVVYGSQEEYRRKTQQPEWSGGASVGNAIYTYYGPMLARTLNHEITHLIFFEFMGRADNDKRWVNEGLAVYEETKSAGGLQGGQADLFGSVRALLRQQPLSMDQMVNLVPATEREYAVSLWYAQAESLVQFMIERGGRIGFGQFLQSLRDGRTTDVSLAAGFPGTWRDLNDLNQSWQRNSQ